MDAEYVLPARVQRAAYLQMLCVQTRAWGLQSTYALLHFVTRDRRVLLKWKLSDTLICLFVIQTLRKVFNLEGKVWHFNIFYSIYVLLENLEITKCHRGDFKLRSE